MNKEIFIEKFGKEEGTQKYINHRAYQNNYYKTHKSKVVARRVKQIQEAIDYVKWFYSNKNWTGTHEIHQYFQHPNLSFALERDPHAMKMKKTYKENHCTCEICSKPAECTHHKIPKTDYYKILVENDYGTHIDIISRINADDNLMALCNNCHKKLHEQLKEGDN